ncbi:putative Monooxygenase [Tripterygium wilfordii]|uniref:Putative Monooxygenase n=1 Tax=Tripterygium wilfordii TaxID=458696 RepID=A0A7J7DVX0_TRIWF|nr:monooxygenase 1-like [Tripterygium wilfordii]KAF5750520.1 putative Monooxygenase [Tripterygium wilfordii]
MGHEADVVIVGGGICGLATALALHRKGIKSVVLERSDTLRATGAAIIVHANGWRALDQLGVASVLRQTAYPLHSVQFIPVHDDNIGKRKVKPYGEEELRCLKRTDLIKVFADNLAPNTVRLGCQVESIKLDPITSFPVLQLHDGSTLKAKVVIGCDGVNSVIANMFELHPTRVSPACVARGFTNYPDCHGFEKGVLIFRHDNVQLGRMPITDKLAYWFLVREWTSQDSVVSRDQALIRESTMQSLKGFPTDALEMIKRSDLDSLRFTGLKYRAPWDLLRGQFRKGTVALAGDAMHAMCPFIAQGGSASLEDSVVLARCISGKMCKSRVDIEEALDQYVKERRMRVFCLSFETYLVGMMNYGRFALARVLGIILLAILFRDSFGHTHFHCGQL